MIKIDKEDINCLKLTLFRKLLHKDKKEFFTTLERKISLKDN